MKGGECAGNLSFASTSWRVFNQQTLHALNAVYSMIASMVQLYPIKSGTLILAATFATRNDDAVKLHTFPPSLSLASKRSQRRQKVQCTKLVHALANFSLSWNPSTSTSQWRHPARGATHTVHTRSFQWNKTWSLMLFIFLLTAVACLLTSANARTLRQVRLIRLLRAV